MMVRRKPLFGSPMPQAAKGLPVANPKQSCLTRHQPDIKSWRPWWRFWTDGAFKPPCWQGKGQKYFQANFRL